MRADEAARVLAEAAAAGPVGSVLLFGGEPLLNPETVLTGIRVVARLDVPRGGPHHERLLGRNEGGRRRLGRAAA